MGVVLRRMERKMKEEPRMESERMRYRKANSSCMEIINVVIDSNN